MVINWVANYELKDELISSSLYVWPSISKHKQDSGAYFLIEWVAIYELNNELISSSLYVWPYISMHKQDIQSITE